MSVSKTGQGRPNRREPSETLIIGLGNTQRRDDGIGPFIVERLEAILHIAETFRFLAVSRLAFKIVDEIRSAGVVIFIDATMDNLDKGWRCELLVPEICLTHFHVQNLSPALLLGLSQSLYHRDPPAWMVSVQGEDFGVGNEISPAARKRVEKAFSNIVETVLNIQEKGGI